MVELLKYSEVATAASVTWQRAKMCIKSTVYLLSGCLKNGKNVAVVLKGIGVLHIDLSNEILPRLPREAVRQREIQKSSSQGPLAAGHGGVPSGTGGLPGALWLPCRLSRISLMGLEKRRRCGDFIAAFQYTKGASKQEGSRTFTVGVGTEGNSLMGVMVSCSEVDVLGGRRGFVAECGKSLCSFLKAAIFQLERASRDRWYPLRALSCRNNWKLASFLVIPCSGKALTDKTTVMLDFLWLQISLMGLEKRRRCGDFIAAFQYTKGASKQEGSRTFTVGVGTEGNSLMGVMVSCSEVDVLGGRRGFVAECGKSLCSFLKPIGRWSR
ncbi:uncharacterized protein LOC121112842 isoform X2 [Gallus gallus]|uniref:uncharacterized protein LOC121112842 isoform X2 n=1 Tax=Gallus gallus TaxID=9031 RepID=UPI001AE20DFD|nr:uncharacterized protein LOC121112842 isoform X2 [Gallus gallus]